MTPFAKKVYRTVIKIPAGQVRSYKWVAKKAGYPDAARAVGQVLKRNPFLVTIPCHRVINANGALGGYKKGKIAKLELLKFEQKIINSSRISH